RSDFPRSVDNFSVDVIIVSEGTGQAIHPCVATDTSVFIDLGSSPWRTVNVSAVPEVGNGRIVQRFHVSTQKVFHRKGHRSSVGSCEEIGRSVGTGTQETRDG